VPLLQRRTVLGALVAVPLARPYVVRAQNAAVSIKVVLLSDVSGPYRDNGGVGSRVAVEMAVADFGGSLLGRPIEVLQVDDQNKPDVASSLARQYIDTEGVSLLLDGASSAAALAIQQVASEKKRVYCTTTSIANALVGKQCSSTGFQFYANAYALTKGVADTLTRQGGDSWFIITVDYESGYALQSSMEEFVKAAGGKILGAARTPLGTPDYSSYLVEAMSSGARVIGLGLAGVDLQNCIKQAHEFGLTKAGQRLATPIIAESDVLAIGQNIAEGLVLSGSFYWNLSPATRAWSARYIEKTNRPPGAGQASAYSAATHWLKAAQAAGTLDADVVAAKMHQMPITDFYNAGIRIQASGSVPLTMYLFQVKPSAEATERWDIYNLLGTITSPNAFPAPDAFGCPLAKT
jgi:branched-chain amino acid transport system substrate-binding protein